MMYIARCKKGKIIAGAIANTPIEQAEAAGDVKRWTKKGYKVTLEAPDVIHQWCLDGKCKRCKLEDVE